QSQRLLMDTIAVSIDEAGEVFRPFSDGPLVKAVADSIVRERYYARIAEKPRDGDTQAKLSERQGRAFRRSIASALNAKILVAADHNGERVLWLPS
ncbi:MAG: hypothetical protein ACR65X_06255, partial [Methylocystis sp.]